MLDVWIVALNLKQALDWGLSWRDWSKNDLVYTVFILVLVIFLIVLISSYKLLESFFNQTWLL